VYYTPPTDREYNIALKKFGQDHGQEDTKMHNKVIENLKKNYTLNTLSLKRTH